MVQTVHGRLNVSLGGWGGQRLIQAKTDPEKFRDYLRAVKDRGLNCVRPLFHPPNAAKANDANWARFDWEAMDRAAAITQEEGVYFLVDYHNWLVNDTIHAHEQEWLQAWGWLVSHYKDYRPRIFEGYNEPQYNCPCLIEHYQNWIDRVRAQSGRPMCVVSPFWGKYSAIEDPANNWAQCRHQYFTPQNAATPEKARSEADWQSAIQQTRLSALRWPAQADNNVRAPAPPAAWSASWFSRPRFALCFLRLDLSLAATMSLVEQVQRAGVVGAGGGGFPTHVKLAAKADTVIANGAECEPLLHKDAAVMQHHAAELVAGMRLCMEAVGASDGVIGIKAKKHEAVKAVQAACQGTAVRVQLLGDYYPAGDEYDLVFNVTGRLIPPAGIPLAVGVVVNNVETLVNVAAAAQGRPVIQKTLTLAGAVRRPITVTVPLGIRLREVVEAAGGLTTDDPVLCLGGLLMGETTDDLDTPVTKTTTGVVILPRDHHVIQRKLKPAVAQNQIGKSACDQCRYCTEYCPRFLLGYAVEPHQVMRSLAFTATGTEYWNQWASLCCSCGLCTLYACPEELFPKEACDNSKAEMKRAGLKWTGKTTVKPHPMRDGRHVPIKSLMKKLHVLDYDHPAPLENLSLAPRQVILPLKQSAGVPNLPLVKPGDRVAAGQPLGEVPPKALGAILHAPFAGRIVSVTDRIVLERT